MDWFKIIDKVILGAVCGLMFYLFSILLKWIKSFFGNKQE